MPKYTHGGFGGKIDWSSDEVEDSTAQDIAIWDASGNASTLGIGTLGQVLSVNASTALEWTSPSEPPVGTILPWLKSYTNTPALPTGWVECDGSVLSDAGSVYNGQTLPDLNGDNQFVRGNSTSGGTGGSSSHTHSGSAGAPNDIGGETLNRHIDSQTTLPPYYDVVWIIKVK